MFSLPLLMSLGQIFLLRTEIYSANFPPHVPNTDGVFATLAHLLHRRAFFIFFFFRRVDQRWQTTILVDVTIISKACSGIAEGMVTMADMTFASLVVASPQGTLYFRTLAPNTLRFLFHQHIPWFLWVFSKTTSRAWKRVLPGEELHQPSSTNDASFLKVKLGGNIPS